jgi:hypothetical protein
MKRFNGHFHAKKRNTNKLKQKVIIYLLTTMTDEQTPDLQPETRMLLNNQYYAFAMLKLKQWIS